MQVHTNNKKYQKNVQMKIHNKEILNIKIYINMISENVNNFLDDINDHL